MLTDLISQLHQSLGILHKQDIQTIAHAYQKFLPASPAAAPRLGDDCAAIPDQNGYLLLAAEGILPSFLETDPWFAGWCAVMVNVSDIYAMGGTPIAVVDTIWSESPELSQPLLQGMYAAATAYNVPIVGGHTNGHSPYNALSIAILGRAKHLITSFNAQPEDCLLMAIDPRGEMHPHYPFWNAATTADPARLREDLALLPTIAAAGWCNAGKDISMGGIVGTVLMLLETSNCGAMLNLDAVPRPADVPADVPPERWLTSFPSYGFLLSVRPEYVQPIQALFHDRHLCCEPVGTVISEPHLILQTQTESARFWDLSQRRFTGFAPTSVPSA